MLQLTFLTILTLAICLMFAPRYFWRNYFPTKNIENILIMIGSLPPKRLQPLDDWSVES